MGDSIVVCGKEFDIGTKVVLWDEEGGLNAYDTTKYVWREEDRRTGRNKTRVVKGRRYRQRSLLAVNPSLPELQGMVTQLFLHHSGLYRSQSTFKVLHKERGLSCHFIIDDDGTIYQTLDLKEKAQHGGKCNAKSIGVEIDSRADADRFPNAYDEANQRKYGVLPRRKRVEFVNGGRITGYEYNDLQYRALIKLTVAICNIFPIIGTNMDFPRNAVGNVIKEKILNPKNHLGFICHFQSNNNKIDPVAFDFDRFLSGVISNEPKQPSSWVSEPQEEPVGFNPTVDWAFEDLRVEPNPEPVPEAIVLSTWRDVQEALVELGYNPGDVDGILGKRTKKAIRSFQAGNQLQIDGIWGPETEGKVIELLRRKRNV